ncbi:MAG: hypothetical protein DCC75_01290 [Proteobacteria bacterium]|nr:MAG: hypothetical protein DCC75_01290 [Pseudomonadota bacterium]
MINQLLDAFALNPKERAVFGSLLEHGTQRASTIAKQLELPRNTVRDILDKLAKEGLIVRTRRGNAQYYATETKDGLLRALETQLNDFTSGLKQRIEAVRQAGDLLSPPSASAARPKVAYYEGWKGLSKVYEDTLTSKSGLRSWASFDANREALPRYFETYYRRRAKRGIAMRSIHPDSALARAHQSRNKLERRECILVPAKYHWTPEIQVYDDKINIVSWQEKLGIIIESAELAHALKSIFDLSYDALKCTPARFGAKKG